MRDEAKSLLFVLYAKWGPEVQNLIGEILKLFLFNQTRRADGRAGERGPFFDAGWNEISLQINNVGLA